MATTNSINEPTAASGKVLQGQGIGTASAFSTATYPSTATGTGKILIADGTNWVASTPTYPNTSGSAGKVVVSDGTNNVYSTPTFPNASATSRKIIVSDGTNWLASTETWATPGSSGNVLTSDGTNWTSAAASGPGGLTAVNFNLTSAQIKALHGTPITIVAAPGAGKVLIPVAFFMSKFNYGGSNVFTASLGQIIELWYGPTSGVQIAQLVANSDLTGTTSIYNFLSYNSRLTQAKTIFENQPLKAYNSVVTEITGNASNNNTISGTFLYYTETLT